MIKGRPPRLKPVFDSYTAPLFLVTACTLHRRLFPSMRTATAAFVSYATGSVLQHLRRPFVIMPDHLHFFICGDHNFLLSQWAKGLKRGMSNAFSAGDDRLKWQPGLFDHLLRNDESYPEMEPRARKSGSRRISEVDRRLALPR